MNTPAYPSGDHPIESRAPGAPLPKVSVGLLRQIELPSLLLAVAALGVSAAMLLSVPVLAYRWIQLPFIGAFPEQTLVFNSMGSTAGAPWPAYDAGLRFPDHLIALDGVPVREADDFRRALESRAIGDEVRLTYTDAEGAVRTVDVRLRDFPSEDLFNYFVVPYLIGLAHWVIGLWVLRLRWRDTAGRALALFCASVAIVVGGLFDLYTTHAFTWAWTMAIPLTSAGLLTLGLVFPQESQLAARHPGLRWVGLIPAAVLILRGEWWLYDTAQPARYAAAWLDEYSFGGLGLVAFLVVIFYRWWRAPSPIVREQAKVVVWGGALGFGPMIYYLTLVTLRIPIIFDVKIFFSPLVVFPAAIAYGILRYRLLDADQLVRRGLMYLVMSALAGAAYMLLLAGASIAVARALPPDHPLLVAALAFALAATFNPLWGKMQQWVDWKFFRGSREYRQRFQDFTRELTKAADLNAVLSLLRGQVERTIRPGGVRFFLLDEAGERFVPYPAEAHGDDDEARFDVAGNLARALGDHRGALLLPAGPAPPARGLLRAARHDGGDRERLAGLGVNVLAPFSEKRGLLGWMALGPKRSGEPYDRDDITFLEALADQTTLAIERARLFEAERRRRQEAETLREAMAAVTSSDHLPRVLDDILTHLNRVVPYDSASVFLQEGAHFRVVAGRGFPSPDRAFVREYPAHSPLFSEIRRQGRPLIVRDAAHDPRFMAWDGTAHIRGWMGVPLIVRGRLIGHLTVDRMRPGGFTEVEAGLAQALANQAAAAIANILHAERLHSLYQAGIDRHESERTELARELHDEVLNALAQMATGADAATVPEALREGYRAITTRIREMITGLRPAMLNYGLGAALTQLADDLAERAGERVDVRVSIEDGGARFNPATEQHVYRIVQQAGENALRHAQASVIRVYGRIQADAVELTVEDDGVGSGLGETLDLADLLAHKRYGVAGMLERAALIDAAVKIEPCPGGGTRVRLYWAPPAGYGG